MPCRSFRTLALVRSLIRRSFSVTCPGPTCPYTPPTSAELGAAAIDVLARMNIERACRGRDCLYKGAEIELGALLRRLPGAAITSWTLLKLQPSGRASHSMVADYGGTSLQAIPSRLVLALPHRDRARGSIRAGSCTHMVMRSHCCPARPHRSQWVRRAPASGAIYGWPSCFSIPAKPASAAENQGHASTQRLSENNVYVQSGGTITTVTDSEGTGHAGPLPPPTTDRGWVHTFRGVRHRRLTWRCTRPPRTRRGPARSPPLKTPVTGFAATPDGSGYWPCRRLWDSRHPWRRRLLGRRHSELTSGSPVWSVSAADPTGGYWLATANGGILLLRRSPVPWDRSPATTSQWTTWWPSCRHHAAAGTGLVSADGGRVRLRERRFPRVPSFPAWDCRCDDVVGGRRQPDRGRLLARRQ